MISIPTCACIRVKWLYAHITRRGLKAQAVPAACRSLCSRMRTYIGSFKVSRARPVLGCEGPST